MEPADLQRSLEFLVGAACSIPDQDFFAQVAVEIPSLDAVTFAQLTRILIAAGEDRVSSDFFEFFVGLGPSYNGRVGGWRRLAMCHYGNFRFAYRELCLASKDELEASLTWRPVNLVSRADFGDGIQPISLEDTPLLGYIAGAPAQALAKKEAAGEALDPREQAYLDRFERAHASGLHNTYEYVCSPWMDVYVATSMRASEDFYSVARFVDEVFKQGIDHAPVLRKVAYFDPTQSYHEDRIVKGIVEGLMLKRAVCTLYLAQETDTLGKDSELATTLAQGKPVIAFVPKSDPEQTQILVDDLKRAAAEEIVAIEGEQPEFVRLVDRYAQMLVHPQFRIAWEELDLANGIGSEGQFDAAVKRFAIELSSIYDRRANTLLHSHPLGLQINLESGVANGILVTRSPGECRELILDVLQNGLTFEIQAQNRADDHWELDLLAPIDWDRYLIEQRTGSVHRVVVSDELISNAFWNWYFE